MNDASATTCPYDHDFCQNKQDKLNEWKNAISIMARNKINRVICTSADMFADCPMFPHSQCRRFLRYKTILEKAKGK